MKFNVLLISTVIASLIGTSLVQALPAWTKNAVTVGEMARGIDAADIDGNGQLDLLITGERKVFSVLNPVTNAELKTVADYQDGVLLYGSSIDFDQDGDLDFAVARETNPWIKYRKKLAAGEKPAKPLGPDFTLMVLKNSQSLEKPMTQQIIDTELHGIHGLTMSDLNNDNRPDIIGNSIKGALENSLAWFENKPKLFKKHAAKFKRHFVTKNKADLRPHYMHTQDMNNDGFQDVLVSCSGGNTVSWWKNPGKHKKQGWQKHLIAKNEVGATNVYAVDLNGDQKLDIVTSNGHGQGVQWFRNKSHTEKGNHWVRHSIDRELKEVHALTVGDFDNDGDIDIVAASYGDKIVRWYENNSKGEFTAHTIDENTGQEAYDIKAVDLDNNGTLDLILAGRKSNNAVWYLNK